jgi:uncharacterized protein YjiK
MSTGWWKVAIGAAIGASVLGVVIGTAFVDRPSASAMPREAETIPSQPIQQVEARLPRYDFSDAGRVTIRLPRALQEISGLALDGQGRLWAHNDETAAIYRIDPSSGEILQTISIGRAGLTGDFEGIAVVGDRFFLVTSGATLVEFGEPSGEGRTPYRRVTTGLDQRCEVEGLAYDSATASLLLPCKTSRRPEDDDRVIIYGVPVATLALEVRPRVVVPHADLVAAGFDRGFHPSSIEVHPETGSFFLVSAQEEAVIEVSATGRLLAWERLPRRVHPQPEGITFGPRLELWLGDEGGGERGTLTTYRVSAIPDGGGG